MRNYGAHEVRFQGNKDGFGGAIRCAIEAQQVSSMHWYLEGDRGHVGTRVGQL